MYNKSGHGKGVVGDAVKLLVENLQSLLGDVMKGKMKDVPRVIKKLFKSVNAFKIRVHVPIDIKSKLDKCEQDARDGHFGNVTNGLLEIILEVLQGTVFLQ